MTARPLLAFGPPTLGAIPTASPSYSPPPRTPSAQRQGQRITPQFEALSQALEAQRASAVEDTAESDPELVVVFDLAGTVDSFVRAVRDIDGLEFLVELVDEPTEPDEDFVYVDDGVETDRLLPETLYVVMSNAQAVAEMVRLFELWQADQSATFPHGYAPLKQAFAFLRSVRRWGPEDRVRETGLLDAWREDLAVIGQSGRTRVEIELWFRRDPEERRFAQSQVGRILESSGAAVVTSSLIPEIDYHAILADVPYAQVESVLRDGADAIELLTTELIMFVGPARPMTVPTLEPSSSSIDQADFQDPPTRAPRIALLDGLPMANHRALVDRLVIDDPDDLGQSYALRSQHHGTAMASIICHGDLSAPSPALSTTLYVRPIMTPHEFFDDREQVCTSELFVDLLHRCFVRMFEGDGSAPPAAPSVRIINLSIGDSARVFTRRISPAAKLLDWLSHRFNVLVIVSAGNHEFEPSVATDALNDQPALQEAVLKERFRQARHLGLLAPAEAVNVLTVGSTHKDRAAIVPSDTALDLVSDGMPAPYSALGFGFRRSVKPEVLVPGGRQLYSRPVGDSQMPMANLAGANHSATGPGILVAAPSRSGGSTGTAFSTGTSNSAALASRAANRVFDLLESSAHPDDFEFPDPQFHPVLAKTLLVHAAQWGDAADKLRRVLQLDQQTSRRDLTQLLGYGPIDPERIATASRERAVLLGAGIINAEQRHSFSLPLPAGLAATTEWRRLTITLGWLSPINSRSRLHRQARLWFTAPEGNLGGTRQQADANAVKMGTVQHEVFEGQRGLAFSDGATCQVHVDCRVDAGRLTDPVRYGLAVSIEMAEAVKADIHHQVRQALRTEVRARSQVVAR